MATEPRHRTPYRGWQHAIRRSLASAILALIVVFHSAAAFAAPRIGIATMQPGGIFFERFGHNAVIVDDPQAGTPLSYNFGMFDLGEQGFVGRFMRGEMMYRLGTAPWPDDLRYYQENGRGVSIQWLALDETQARMVADALRENALPENARYRYDYFADNCATRVRDVVDLAIGGTLKPQLVSRSEGNSYRSEAVRLASPAWWMWLGFDIGLGPASDVPLSRWQDAYVPMRLANSLREARLPDGRPLVLTEQIVSEHRIAPEPPEFQRRWWLWGLAGLMIAAAWAALRIRHPRSAAALALLFWVVAAILGTLMLFIWFGTEHRFGWRNHNLLLFSPWCLLLLRGGWRLMRGRDPGRLFKISLAATAAGALLAPFVHWISLYTNHLLPQANAHWIALLLPIHVMLAWAFSRSAAGTSTRPAGLP